MAATLSGLRALAGIDDDVVTDDALQVYLDTAIDWYAHAGVLTTTTGASYAFWVENLAAWLYDHRGGSDAIPPLFLASVHQLRPPRG